jgi:hypothetical protein
VGKVRDEFLVSEEFRSLPETRGLTSARKRERNEV